MEKPLDYYYNLANNDPVEAFIDTIRDGDYKAFEKLLGIQKDINVMDNSDSGWTYLMYAVFEESLAMVKKLVEVGADVNIRASKPYEDEFALNLAAYGCCSASYYYEFIRSKEIYDYLFPLTSLELQKIAETTLNSRTNTMFR